MRRATGLLVLVWLASIPVRGQVELQIEPDRATVGDPLTVRLSIDVAEGQQPVRANLGPNLGSFSVLDERWTLDPEADSERWVWSATVVAFETGELEFPALSIATLDGTGSGWRSDAVSIEIVSVLGDTEQSEEPPEIADLKGPAGVAADFSALWLAAIVFAVLVGLSVLGWWLYRRYAARFAAAPTVEDPFARIAPHEWAFEALQELLDRAGQESADRFYAQLSWILKRYLGGRFRIDLLEHTTEEAPGLLEQAAAPTTAVARIAGVLGECDAVKFAKRRPSTGERKDVVDRVYGIIDQTKPVERAVQATGAA